MPYKAYQPNTQPKAGNSQTMASTMNTTPVSSEDKLPSWQKPHVSQQNSGGQPSGVAEAPTDQIKKFNSFGGAKLKPVSNAIKKRRTNYRLRKIIIPKTPLMVLNEMVGAIAYSFIDTPATPGQPVTNNLFTAQCVVEGEKYNGSGPSKQSAKNVCAELAIQAVVSKKCADPINKKKLDDEGNPVKPNHMEDETPWAQLASLALFKLFNDWQAQGYQLPPDLLKTSSEGDAKNVVPNDHITSIKGGTSQEKKTVKGKGARKIPQNPTERHPVQLLNEIQGGVNYTLLEEEGANLTTFIMGAEIEGITFKGKGKNKKDAKRNCALAALKQIYDIVYPVKSG